MPTNLLRDRSRRLAPALACLGLLLTGCDDSGGNANVATGTPGASGGPAPAVTTPAPFTPTAQGPQIEFEKLEHDFGVISDTEKHATSFTFRNVGSQTLQVHDVKAACGCTVPNRRRFSLAPGESDQIDIIFDPKGKMNKTDKYITIVSNSVTEPSLKLFLTSDIQPLLGFERMHNMGNIALGSGRVETIPLFHTDPNLEFIEVKCENPSVGVRIVESGVAESDGDSVKYRASLEVSVSPETPWGLIYATRAEMKVRGRAWPDSEPVTYDYTMYLLGTVYGEVRAKQGIISLGNVTSGTPIRASTQITRTSGQPFAVGNVRVTESSLRGLDASVEKISQNTYRVWVEGSPGAYRGSVKGVITLETDVPGEEVLTLRFAGQVK
jgi:hypothetical protein